MIGDRAHGEKSTNGVKVVEKGPLTKDELNHIVGTASQKGREGTVVAASFLTIVVKFLINHELFHWETYTKKS